MKKYRFTCRIVVLKLGKRLGASKVGLWRETVQLIRQAKHRVNKHVYT